MPDTSRVSRPSQVLLFWPNIIGYVRIALLMSSLFCFGYPILFITLYSLSWILDCLDGIVARRMNQVSEFGAWFDIVVDIIGRGTLWTYVSPKVGYLISCVEWLCFVCTHTLGGKWKSCRGQPTIVNFVMRNNYRTIAGQHAMSGMWGLPMWLYISGSFGLYREPYFSLITTILATGRVLGGICELWYIFDHIETLLMQSVECDEDKVD